jgi:hypothetical protein
MSDEYHVPEWDCLDDILDVTKEIGKISSKILLGEFIHTADHASNHDIERLLQDFAQRNVIAALELAAKGLSEQHADSPDGRIEIIEAIRIVRELDYTDDDD